MQTQGTKFKDTKEQIIEKFLSDFNLLVPSGEANIVTSFINIYTHTHKHTHAFVTYKSQYVHSYLFQLLMIVFYIVSASFFLHLTTSWRDFPIGTKTDCFNLLQGSVIVHHIHIPLLQDISRFLICCKYKCCNNQPFTCMCCLYSINSQKWNCPRT